MERFEQRLLRYASRFVQREAAKDIVQDAFTRLWKEEEQKLSGREREWLFCVVRNLSIDQIRKNKKVKILEEEGVSIPIVEEVIMFQQEMGDIQRFVLALPPTTTRSDSLKIPGVDELPRNFGHHWL